MIYHAKILLTLLPMFTNPIPESQENFNQLKVLMREMFQLDRGDLDFGLYRIMNMMSDKVTKFLDSDLLPQVRTILAELSKEDKSDLEKQIEEARTAARGLGINPDCAPRVVELKRQLTEDVKAEADVYGHLVNFFSRYYHEGDFMSLRRYSAGGGSAYHIPYDGEEVMLHWANADQYYIKTEENYASYAFMPQKNRQVRFETVAAGNTKDNIKEANGKQRRFVLASGKCAIEARGDTLTIRFEHRPLTDGEKKKFPGNGNGQQNRINRAIAENVLRSLESDWQACLSELEPTTTNGERTKLDKHVERYTAKNSFDYFIHKDLGGFLRREMDFYLKNEILNLNDLTVSDMVQIRRTQLRMRATREIGEKIISFLEQLENFQKKLWLKKKFVLETHWCVTLDRVPETFYTKIAANEKQIEEWKELLAINEIEGDRANGNAEYSDPVTPEFLKANPHLILDTKHFSRDFTNRILSALSKTEHLDDQADGLLVHGENFQAINLLRTRFHGQVKCIYIDPPYNTAASEIIYKNGYKHSSWLSLLENRLSLGKDMLADSGVQITAIDDTEFAPLAHVLDQIFLGFDRAVVVVNHHSSGAGLERANISDTHEYAIFMLPQGKKVLNGEPVESSDNKGLSFIRTGTAASNKRVGRPNSFYAVLVDLDSLLVVGAEPPPLGDYPTDNTEDGYKRIYPLGKNGEERVWRRSYKSCLKEISAGNLSCKNGNTIYLKNKSKDKRHRPIFSNWTDKKYNAGAHGTNVLKAIIGENIFSYPKSIYTVADCINSTTRTSKDGLVLDYFAGSGTTGHAVICLNRDDGGQRKYLMVEVADYFDTVLLPRTKKVVYSPDWKDGKPTSPDKGISQLFKYIRLESYEDTLDGLVWVPSESDLFADNPSLSEDYQLRYSLDVETQGSANLLGLNCSDPFAYTISIVRDGVRQDVPVDLPETFNYLIGLRVHTYQELDNVLSITGIDSQRRNCLILWRNLEEIGNAELEKWFNLNRKHFSGPLDLVYVNGDHTLNAIRGKKDTWTVEIIEPVFRALMFEDCKHGK